MRAYKLESSTTDIIIQSEGKYYQFDTNKLNGLSELTDISSDRVVNKGDIEIKRLADNGQSITKQKLKKIDFDTLSNKEIVALMAAATMLPTRSSAQLNENVSKRFIELNKSMKKYDKNSPEALNIQREWVILELTNDVRIHNEDIKALRAYRASSNKDRKILDATNNIIDDMNKYIDMSYISIMTTGNDDNDIKVLVNDMSCQFTNYKIQINRIEDLLMKQIDNDKHVPNIDFLTQLDNFSNELKGISHQLSELADQAVQPEVKKQIRQYNCSLRNRVHYFDTLSSEYNDQLRIHEGITAYQPPQSDFNFGGGR